MRSIRCSSWVVHVGVAAVALASDAHAQSVTLHNNQIRGSVLLTNANPEVLSVLQDNGLDLCRASAVSAPSGYSAISSYITSVSPVRCDYSMEVEAVGVGGGAGVDYSVAATGWTYRRTANAHGNGQFWFPAQSAHVDPPIADPDAPGQTLNPTTVDFAQCLGVVRLRFGYDGDCDGRPATIVSGVAWGSHTFSYFGSGSTHYLFHPDGVAPETMTLGYQLGSDPYLDQFSFHHTMTLSATCDEIQDECIAVPVGDGGDGLGELTGPLDVVGETLLPLTGTNSPLRVHVDDGPDGNFRHAHVSGSNAPADDPSSWWHLLNLPGGRYSLTATVNMRSGQSFTRVTTRATRDNPDPPGRVEAVAGQVSTAQKAGRYPLVMTPGFFRGDIVLSDPYARDHGTFSTLSTLRPRPSWDPYQTSGEPTTTIGAAQDPYFIGAVSSTSFDFSYDASLGRIDATYEQVLLNMYDAPVRWAQNGLNLVFWSHGDESVYYLTPGAYDASHRNGSLSIVQRDAVSTVSPGSSFTIDHRYCFSEVTIDYSIQSGLLFNPGANFTGYGNGDPSNWDYYASGSFSGTPAAGWYADQNLARAVAAPTGRVVMALPVGSYHITPGIAAVSASGAISDTLFEPFDLEVGCGQRVNVTPGLSLDIHAPACGADGAASLVVRPVTSVPMTRIWYTVNGGAAVDVCTGAACAASSYLVSAPLARCNNTVQVFAQADGIAAPVSVTSTVVWDAPDDGLVCGDGACCVDLDGDDVCDEIDNCAGLSNGEQADADADGVGDACDSCPHARNVTQVDTDADGIGDACDNCPGAANVDQADADADGAGDACDSCFGACEPICVKIQRGLFGEVADSFVWEKFPRYNDGANVYAYTGVVGGYEKKALYRFGLDFIPEGSTVVSATFGTLMYSNASQPIGVHRITAPWSESAVTWGNFAGSFDPAVAASLPVTSDGSRTSDLTALVQAWVDGTVANHGFLLEGTSTSSTSLRSSEQGTLGKRPWLEVCYVPDP